MRSKIDNDDLGLQLGTSPFNLSPLLVVSPRHARGAAEGRSLTFLEIPRDFTSNPVWCKGWQVRIPPRDHSYRGLPR